RVVVGGPAASRRPAELGRARRRGLQRPRPVARPARRPAARRRRVRAGGDLLLDAALGRPPPERVPAARRRQPQRARALAGGPAGPDGSLPGRTIWVTETGAGALPPGRPRPAGTAALGAGCRSLAALLDRWYRDPRVATAFQYTLRDDPGFPVGLSPPATGPPYPTFALWRAWGARPDPTAPPPPLPAPCR